MSDDRLAGSRMLRRMLADVAAGQRVDLAVLDEDFNRPNVEELADR